MDDEERFANPLLKRLANKDKTGAAYKRSRKQERETRERIGGKAIPASGSRFRKGDNEIPDLVRIENKCTQADSFRVTRGMMQKVLEAGILEGQLPYIEIEFVDNVSNVLDAYCVVRRQDLEQLVTRVADAEGIGTTDKRSFRRPELHGSKLATSKRVRGLQDTRKRRSGD